ncbi:protein Bouncer-like isoform X2 [Anarrhichthys ocellatus]|uniref:protein Bouncer-like isoform X2 n=1 Tax=Anarrhichthys ocellatus TaxID=433405 RepID=UPI0012ECC252|nr:protein Bouncer-like isoform X2 [Anarrhichthys ocellatus]
MGSQREIRLLTSILFATALVLPALSLDSLLCNYCPLQQKGQSCPIIVSQCLPDQRCSSSRGHYGSLHILSAQGCVDTELCGSHEIASYRGVKYNVSHTCCCKDKCNSQPKSHANLKMLIGMIDYTNTTNVLREELWDSCANYTSGSSTLPATAS